MTKKTERVTKILKERRKKVKTQTQIATKTVQILSWMTLTKISTRQKLKEDWIEQKEARKRLKKR